MGRTFRKERILDEYASRKPKKTLNAVQHKKTNKNLNFVDIEEEDDYTFEEYDEPEQLHEDRSK